VKTKRS